MLDQYDVLDHGYLKFIESWGSDQRIIEAARMSTDKGFLGWGPVCSLCGDPFDGPVRECPNRIQGQREYVDCGRGGHKFDAKGDEKLLAYLYNNKHSTPFEMAGLVIEVQAPIFVFREWHRHRTQCLAGNSMIWFNRPCDGKPYRVSLFDLAKRWNPLMSKKHRYNQFPQGKHVYEWNRKRIKGMRIRMHEGQSISGSTQISDVIYSGSKKLYRLHSNGRTIEASADHLFETPEGWFPLSDLSGKEVYQSWTGGNRKANTFPIFTEQDFAREEWREFEDGQEVSNLGRVRTWWGLGARFKKAEPILRVGTVNKAGRVVVTVKNKVHQVSHLVWKMFEGDILSEGMQILHKDDNSLDNRISNLYMGNQKDNAMDRVNNGGQQRLRIVPKKIDKIEFCGTGETFDLSVIAEQHNFIANGFVTHNSYSELSARYTPLPDVNYVPSVERLMMNSKVNKQAGTIKGAEELTEEKAKEFQHSLKRQYMESQIFYTCCLEYGVPKELARIALPVGRYSRMRASANLRNWLAFLTLRMASNAQWEIQQYANTLGLIIKELFPRTWELFHGGNSL